MDVIHPSVPIHPILPAGITGHVAHWCVCKKGESEDSVGSLSLSRRSWLACDRAANLPPGSPGQDRGKENKERKQASKHPPPLPFPPRPSTPWRAPRNPRFRLPHTSPTAGAATHWKARPSPTESASDDHSRGFALSRQLIDVLDVPYPIAMLFLSAASSPVSTLTCESCYCESAAPL